MRRSSPVFTLALLILMFAGRGRGGAGDSLAGLQSQVQAVREAAQAGDSRVALERLSSLRASVISLRRQARISESRAQRILAAAGEVQANLGAIAPASGPGSGTFPAPMQPSLQVPVQQLNTPAARSGRGIDGARGRRGGENGKPGEKGEGGD